MQGQTERKNRRGPTRRPNVESCRVCRQAGDGQAAERTPSGRDAPRQGDRQTGGAGRQAAEETSEDLGPGW